MHQEIDNQIELKAELRQVFNKKELNLIRKAGNVPTVIYGKGLKDQVLLTITKKERVHKLKESMFNTKIVLNISNDKVYEVLVKAIDHDLVSGEIIHVDFMNINNQDEEIVCYVPLKLINEGLSPGIKRGGFLNIINRKICIKCIANNMPRFLAIDLSGLEGGAIITAKQIILSDTAYKLLINSEKQIMASIIGGKAATAESSIATASTTKKTSIKKEINRGALIKKLRIE